MDTRGDRNGYLGWALAGAAVLAASWLLVSRWATLGDYPTDAGPSIAALLHGDLHRFFTLEPAMGGLSLFLRAPFAALAYLRGSTQLSIYKWGCVPCVASAGFVGLALARFAGRRGTARIGQLAIVLVAMFNPLVHSALSLGHPEEILTASLCAGALLAAIRQRALATAILLGLALASKQWAVVAVLPMILALDEGRLRALTGAVAVAVAVSLVMLAGSPSHFLSDQLSLAHEQYLEPSIFSWLWPLAPSVQQPVVVGGQHLVVSVTRLPRSVVGLLHPLIIGLSLAIAAWAWRRRRRGAGVEGVVAALALVFLLRCTLDTETMPYYHLGLLLVLLVWDAVRGERVPLRGLACVAASYLIFDWAPGHLGVAGASYLYGGCAVAAAFVLGSALSGRWRQPAIRSAPDAALSA